MCESCWNAVEMQMQMGLGTIRSLLPALSYCLFFFFFIHSFISSNCTVTAFSSLIPWKDCWAAIREREGEGLQRAVGLQRGGGWDESIKICTISNVIAVDAFVVGKGVCARRVSCVLPPPPRIHPGWKQPFPGKAVKNGPSEVK